MIHAIFYLDEYEMNASCKYWYIELKLTTFGQIVWHTLQIFIVILLCKSIKVMGIIYNLMIENFFCKFRHWNLGIPKQLSKPSKNKSQCWSELLSVDKKFWYEYKIELIGNNLLKISNLIVWNTHYKAKN